ncbi:MAG: hypothetical protein ACLTRS_02700 [Lachnospiraceae bacterium]
MHQERSAFQIESYRCSCGYIEDRDRNAALNLKDAATYEIA